MRFNDLKNKNVVYVFWCEILFFNDFFNLQTEKLTGECAVLKRGRRFVYYLVIDSYSKFPL